jgi:HTH-type transcriptional regulator/antitoxin HigA
VEIMSAIAVTPAYTALLAKIPPRVIRTEEEHAFFTGALYELDQRSEKWTAEERELADLLTLLVEDFEEKHYALPKASPVEAIQFLMEQHGLLQKDLVDVFGTASIVSEVLSGKRELNKEQIRRLSERFHVSPELFF